MILLHFEISHQNLNFNIKKQTKLFKSNIHICIFLPGPVTSKISKLFDFDSNFFMLFLITRMSVSFPRVGSCATIPLQPPKRIWNADGTGCICSLSATCE